MSRWQEWYRSGNHGKNPNAEKVAANIVPKRWTPDQWTSWRSRVDWTPPKWKKQRESDLAYHRLMQEELSDGEADMPALRAISSQQPQLRPQVLAPSLDATARDPDQRTAAHRQNAKRIKAIRSYMDVLEPGDVATMASLEEQLKAARVVARGGKAPSVAMEEALTALAEAKVSLEKSAKHLSTVADHHDRALADVARCKEEFAAAKLMNAKPRQSQRGSAVVSSAAASMAMTLEKLKSTAQFGAAGAVAVDLALLQLLTGQI